MSTQSKKNIESLAKACTTPQDVIDFLSKHSFTEKKLVTAINAIPKALKADPAVKAAFSAKITSYATSKLRNAPYGCRADFPRMLACSLPMLDQADIQKLHQVIMDPKVLGEIYYSYVKTDLIHFAANTAETEDQALYLIRTHYKHLSDINKKHLATLIPDGENNADLIDAVSKSPDFLKQFTEADLANPDRRKQLVKVLAKKSSWLKELTMPLTITAEDLKHLPTMMRFDFLCELYAPVISTGQSYYGYYRINRDISTPRDLMYHLSRNDSCQSWRSLVKVDDIPIDEMELLLFSAALQKNERIAAWFEKYKALKTNTTLKAYLTNIASLL